MLSRILEVKAVVETNVPYTRLLLVFSLLFDRLRKRETRTLAFCLPKKLIRRPIVRYENTELTIHTRI